MPTAAQTIGDRRKSLEAAQLFLAVSDGGPFGECSGLLHEVAPPRP
jgi:hypothetical protein